MNYPLISEYIEAIKSAEDNFDELSYLRPVLGNDGQPVMTSGNFAVVFKMKDERDGKLYAVKCFTKEQEGRTEAYKLIAEELKNVDSPYLVPIRFLERELFVDSNQTEETEFPILLMDWVEGKPLDKYLRENLDDQYALEMLAYRFSQLAQWLIPQPFAHGDLKPDNILVCEDGTLVLVDYDGMYVPAMKGQKARELGSPDFRHPQRTEDDFDEHIDDFPLISILLSLKAISVNSQLLEKYGAVDRLLFSEKDYRDISQCRYLKEIFPSEIMEINRLMGLFTIVYSTKKLYEGASNIILLESPKERIFWKDIIEDKYWKSWVEYDKDKKKLIKYKEYGTGEFGELRQYLILKGTEVIGKYAFEGCVNLISVTLPDTIRRIETGAFAGCTNLARFTIPSSVSSITGNPFIGLKLGRIKGWYRKEEAEQYGVSFQIINHSPFFVLENEALFSNDMHTIISCITSKQSFHIPDTVKVIGEAAFAHARDMKIVSIPTSVTTICNEAFCFCDSIVELNVPSSVISIGEKAFDNCWHLVHIFLPNTITTIENNTFSYCGFKEFSIPEGVKEIGHKAFGYCWHLKQITLPSTLIQIVGNPFIECHCEIDCKNQNFRYINGALLSHDYRTMISFTGKTTSYSMPNCVTEMREGVFQGNKYLTRIRVSYNLNAISEKAFSYCKALALVVLPDSIMSIEKDAFYGCDSLKAIIVPKGSKEQIGELLRDYKDIIFERELDELYRFFK